MKRFLSEELSPHCVFRHQTFIGRISCKIDHELLQIFPGLTMIFFVIGLCEPLAEKLKTTLSIAFFKGASFIVGCLFLKINNFY